MKALSIRQPWAWLICKGLKDIENRDWATKVRGRVYIHAGKKLDLDGLSSLIHRPKPRLTSRDILHRAFAQDEIVRGAIIGEVDIIDCKFRFGDENDSLYSPWHTVGQYGFVLVNPVLYAKPIPCKGRLHFFEPNIGLGAA